MRLPQESPVMVLPDAILFPHAMLPLRIFEPRYRRMLEEALNGDRMFCVAMRKPGNSRETPFTIGGLGLIRACVRNPDGTSHLVLEGLSRVELGKVVKRRPYRVQAIRPLPPSSAQGATVQRLVGRLRKLIARRLQQGLMFSGPLTSPSEPPAPNPKLASLLKDGVDRFSRHLAGVKDPEQLADLVSCALLTSSGARQAILETPDLAGRLRCLIRFLEDDIAGHDSP